ncbi:hypothetical protein LWI29_032292 [Acer saccharum]|uniref:Uncharacterized protein n=1 Tax=Acer saccharum TaxID=4024 RepID=A0AA39W5U1_ACESA|nr:hypothetical protein LWI29_032292 [Acer saccharum]
MLHAVPQMAEEDSSVVADKLEVVVGGESGVHEADQQQRHAISAVEYTTGDLDEDARDWRRKRPVQKAAAARGDRDHPYMGPETMEHQN